MFDLRYHVASLAAVFLALVIGILVGVGISSGGFIKKSERSLLTTQIGDLQRRLDAATRRADELAAQQEAAQTFIEDSYPALMAERLSAKRVALVFVGSVDQRLRTLIERTLADAGAPASLRIRALKVPIDMHAIDAIVGERPGLAVQTAGLRPEQIGRQLAYEFVTGGETPLWDALAGQVVAERFGAGSEPADAVVVFRNVPPQGLATGRFLAGFYSELANGDVPAVGVETAGSQLTAVDAFTRAHLSTVDDLDTPAGKLALAVLLAGGKRGHYGLKKSAADGLLPPVPPVQLTTTP